MKIELDEFEKHVLLLPFCGWFIFAGYRVTGFIVKLIEKGITNTTKGEEKNE